jgi:hypothetical protein
VPLPFSFSSDAAAGELVSLPDLLEHYIPPLGELPLFLLKLCTDVSPSVGPAFALCCLDVASAAGICWPLCFSTVLHAARFTTR